MIYIIYILSITHIVFISLYATDIWSEGETKRNAWKSLRGKWFGPYEVFQSIMNGLGVAVGWLGLYYLLFSTKLLDEGLSIINSFGWRHLIILIISLLGLMGYIPKILSALKLSTKI